MKNSVLALLSFLFLFLLSSCREDGDWGNDVQFSFTVDRDDTFIEKAVGENNQLMFNIKPNYDFSSISTKFKFTTSLNGVLKLNGQTLIANQEYTFSNKENIFEYTGNVAGTHDLVITVKNSKGFEKAEQFSLAYGISQFTHTFTGGTTGIYQGDEDSYLLKIVPGSGQPVTGYQIKFNTYSGVIVYNGQQATLGTWYSIPNIDSFTTVLKTSVAGQNKLTYTIKNTTVSKDYEIQQNIQQRSIDIQSMNFATLAVVPNTQLSLTGVINQTPITGSSQNVEYKTWISQGSTTGISNTNNVYVPYTLSNGNFSVNNINAINAGTYTFNIQFRDQYGNESSIKTFTINVEAPIQFTFDPVGKIALTMTQLTDYYRGQEIKFDAQSGGGHIITSIEFTSSFVVGGQTKTWTDVRQVNTNMLSIDEEFVTAQYYTAFGNYGVQNISNPQITIKLTTNLGATVQKTVPATLKTYIQ